MYTCDCSTFSYIYNGLGNPDGLFLDFSMLTSWRLFCKKNSFLGSQPHKQYRFEGLLGRQQIFNGDLGKPLHLI